MKGYKIFYNAEEGRFDYESFLSEVGDTSGITSWNCKLDTTEMAVESLNRKLRDKELFILKCKDCGEYFELTSSEKEWFEHRGMKAPVRCEPCRIKRKREKNNI